MHRNTYSLRLARTDDIPQIEKIFASARSYMANSGNPQWSDGYLYSEIINEGVNGDNFRVIEIGNKIAAVWSVYESDVEYCDINGRWLTDSGEGNANYLAAHTLAVSEEFRGKGLAHAAIGEICAEARRIGKVSVRMDTHLKNLPMQHLLISSGFIQCGSIKSRGEGAFLCFEKVI